MSKYLTGKQLEAKLFKRTEGYAANVRKIYRDALGQIIDLVKDTDLEDGVPFSFDNYGYTEKVQPILRRMYSQTYQAISSGVQKEWLFADENNDALVKAVFGSKSIEDHHFARYFQHNSEAMDAFLKRRSGSGGLNLSERVWKYTGQYREELEGTLDLAIGEGTPANRLASKIQEYLQDPDRWYRRFRVKVGEDENGNPVYGRIWKRRIWSKDDQCYKWINDDPKDYHPGKGVYRSSYRNAQRLARTETNIAYRSAEFERWQTMPFVIGIRISLSNNHPVPDICDDLVGIYPPHTKFTGFHSNCRCYQEPVIADQKTLDQMLDKILDGEDPSTVTAPGAIDEPPAAFRSWMRDNKERYEIAKNKGTLSYFFKDNQKLVEKALYGLSPEEKKAMSMVDLLDSPLDLLKKHGIKDLEALYSAVKSKLGSMLQGDLEHQKSTLEFEIDWVTKHKKYATWEGAANAYKKALNQVNLQIQRKALDADLATIKSFAASHADLSKISELYTKIQTAYDTGEIAQAQLLISDAKVEIDAWYNSQLAKGMHSKTKLEKYCDKHRSFTSEVVDQKSFEKFQERMIKDSGDAWRAADDDARKAVNGYTNGTYDDINRSYWKYHIQDSRGEAMAQILDNISTSFDMALRRGCDMNEMGSIFGDQFQKLCQAGDIDALNRLAGHRGINEGFISTSFDMEGGFWKSVDLRIYAPKGTQALYAKPVSGFGDGYGAAWDGSSARTNLLRGRENEVIVNKGYEYRFIKAEAGGVHNSQITIYIELLTRDNRIVK